MSRRSSGGAAPRETAVSCCCVSVRGSAPGARCQSGRPPGRYGGAGRVGCRARHPFFGSRRHLVVACRSMWENRGVELRLERGQGTAPRAEARVEVSEGVEVRGGVALRRGSPEPVERRADVRGVQPPSPRPPIGGTHRERKLRFPPGSQHRLASRERADEGEQGAQADRATGRHALPVDREGAPAAAVGVSVRAEKNAARACRPRPRLPRSRTGSHGI